MSLVILMVCHTVSVEYNNCLLASVIIDRATLWIFYKGSEFGEVDCAVVWEKYPACILPRERRGSVGAGYLDQMTFNR